MSLKTKHLILINLLYCYIPLFIFLLGWVKLWIAILVTICLGYFLYKFYAGIKESSSVSIPLPVLIGVGLALLVVCVLAGMGNWVLQVPDYNKHNAVLQDLVRFDWPVIYDKYDTALLTYYIGQYLPPALIGKLAGSVRLADYMMGLWGYLGVCLIYLNIITLTNIDKWWKQIIVLGVFLLFSGMLYPLQYILYLICPDLLVYPGTEYSSLGCLTTLFIDGIHLEYRSVFSDVQWVHQQTIIPWLCCCTLMMRRNDYSNYALIILPAFISGTWAFLGIAVIAMVLVTAELITSRGLAWKQVLSWSNVFCVLIPGVILLTYFMGNLFVENDSSSPSEFALDFSTRHLLYRILLMLFMAGIYILLIAKKYHRDILFWAITAELVFIPFMNGPNSVMCISIPALFILLIYIIQYLMTSFSYKDIKQIILIGCLIVGARNPLLQMYKTTDYLPYDNFREESLLEYTDKDNPNLFADMKSQYYTYDINHSIFCKYLMQK